MNLTFPFFVLWLFSPLEWGGYPGLFSAGWLPHEVYYGASLCSSGKVEHEAMLGMKSKDVRCVPMHGAPRPSPVATPIDRYAK